MDRETLTTRQAVCINVLFIFGSTAVMGVSSVTEQDSWIAFLLSVAFTIPAVLVYARLLQLFPGKNFFEMVDALFGRIAGKILTALMTWYAIHLCALVLKNFSEFLEICVLPETPQLAIILSMTLVVCYMARSGLETLGKWAIFALPVVSAIVIFTIVFAVNHMDFARILPVGTHDLGTLSAAGYKLFTFPFAESVIFLCAVGKMRGNGRPYSPYRMYLISIFLAGAILLSILLRNVFLLGPAVVADEYFPSYTAAKIINIADLISRLEGSIAMNFIVAGIVKITLCVFAASKGLAHLLELRDYRQLAFPVGLLGAALSANIFENVAQMVAFADAYKIYAIPFQILIPLGAWLAAEKKHRREQKAAVEDK
ncbi:putative Spore germination protein (Amino acid permease) [uncultured Eubacteriales bacterium]|uniref:Putative Spore germination protein (Amino acid permease) n=1 Tax=uncultured Eubacteriales bacterium TaxID=172733 RepID=A0A212KH49_9FIRM|nr:putative Spore germination protein (Amino acid permease) [uncultured Eubacteriales bacterium]